MSSGQSAGRARHQFPSSKSSRRLHHRLLHPPPRHQGRPRPRQSMPLVRCPQASRHPPSAAGRLRRRSPRPLPSQTRSFLRLRPSLQLTGPRRAQRARQRERAGSPTTRKRKAAAESSGLPRSRPVAGTRRCGLELSPAYWTPRPTRGSEPGTQISQGLRPVIQKGHEFCRQGPQQRKFERRHSHSHCRHTTVNAQLYSQQSDQRLSAPINAPKPPKPR